MVSECLSKHTVLRKILSVAVLFGFVSGSVLADAWAVPYGAVPSGEPSFARLDVDAFSLPAYLGEVRHVFKGSSDKLVVHIQDAHCNYAAQHRIAEIMEYLSREYGIASVNLEGGAGDYDLSIFTDIGEKEIRRKVADYFVKEGLVSGAEYFAVNNPDKANLWGVEDVGLYLENLNIYRDSLKYKTEVENQLKILKHTLSNLKLHIFSKELLEFDIKYNQYKADNLEFKDYLTYLIQKARQKDIDIAPLPNISLFDSSIRQEGTINFEKASSERRRLMSRLESKLSRKDLEELVVKTVEFKKERLSRKDFYAYLAKKAKLANIDVSEFPRLQKYKVYTSLYDSINKAKMMDEINALEEKIKERLCENDKQRKLALLSKHLALLKNIFTFSLKKDEYKYYKENRPAFSIDNYISFITKEAPRHKITATPPPNIRDLDQYREKISEFYEYSFKRDKAFLQNIKFPKTKLRTPNSELRTTILLTGGFHTENLCELLREKDISYISITPEFKTDSKHENPYFRLLEGKKSLAARALSGSVSTMAVFSDFCRHAAKVHGTDRLKADQQWVRSIKMLYQSLFEQKKDITLEGRCYSFEKTDGAEPVTEIGGRKVYAKSVGKVSSAELSGGAGKIKEKAIYGLEGLDDADAALLRKVVAGFLENDTSGFLRDMEDFDVKVVNDAAGKELKMGGNDLCKARIKEDGTRVLYVLEKAFSKENRDRLEYLDLPTELYHLEMGLTGTVVEEGVVVLRSIKRLFRNKDPPAAKKILRSKGWGRVMNSKFFGKFVKGDISRKEQVLFAKSVLNMLGQKTLKGVLSNNIFVCYSIITGEAVKRGALTVADIREVLRFR